MVVERALTAFSMHGSDNVIADMHCVQFMRGSYTLYFKNKLIENNFKELYFLYVRVLADAVPFQHIPMKEPRGIIPFEKKKAF